MISSVIVSLDIKVSTWNRDTYGLFDYTSRDITRSNFRCADNEYIVRSRDTCKLQPSTVVGDADSVLLGISVEEGQFQLHQRDLPEQDQMWLVIRYQKDRSYLLTEGDLLKLGRVYFKVQHIVLSGGPIPSVFNNVNYSDDSQSVESCRICLHDTQTPEDPLVAPCKCSGSMKFVHVGCLKEWLKSKVMSRQSHRATSYFWKDFSCELCKENLPSSIRKAGQVHQLINIEFPSRPYMVLEDLRSDGSHGIHIVTLNNNSYLKIGRAFECDIKISDISVSRTHAIIRFSEQKFYIIDDFSKFGTLALLNSFYMLSRNEPLTLQVSRCVISVLVKKPWKLCSCCSDKKVQPIKCLPTKMDIAEENEARNQSFQEISIDMLMRDGN